MSCSADNMFCGAMTRECPFSRAAVLCGVTGGQGNNDICIDAKDACGGYTALPSIS